MGGFLRYRVFFFLRFGIIGKLFFFVQKALFCVVELQRLVSPEVSNGASREARACASVSAVDGPSPPEMMELKKLYIYRHRLLQR